MRISLVETMIIFLIFNFHQNSRINYWSLNLIVPLMNFLSDKKNQKKKTSDLLEVSTSVETHESISSWLVSVEIYFEWLKNFSRPCRSTSDMMKNTTFTRITRDPIVSRVFVWGKSTRTLLWNLMNSLDRRPDIERTMLKRVFPLDSREKRFLHLTNRFSMKW